MASYFRPMYLDEIRTAGITPGEVSKDIDVAYKWLTFLPEVTGRSRIVVEFFYSGEIEVLPGFDISAFIAVPVETFYIHFSIEMDVKDQKSSEQEEKDCIDHDFIDLVEEINTEVIEQPKRKFFGLDDDFDAQVVVSDQKGRKFFALDE